MADVLLIYGDDWLKVVGPFDSGKEAAAFGARWSAKQGDDPRWQVLRLPIVPFQTSMTVQITRPGGM